MQIVQTFSRCVLSCEEEVDLDELLATRLLSFLMDHHQEVLQVPMYLRNAVEQHTAYLRLQVQQKYMAHQTKIGYILLTSCYYTAGMGNLEHEGPVWCKFLV